MNNSGFHICQVDHCCYIKFFSNSYIILLLYVNDMLIVEKCKQEIHKLKAMLSKEFAMKDFWIAK